ncbi:hypothetical protein [Yersinia enterocolitica]|uniref:hypothetical protein n=1 Tax=Yersinia enterocolitica TaxID=630 RepID=UPI003F4727C7
MARSKVCDLLFLLPLLCVILWFYISMDYLIVGFVYVLPLLISLVMVVYFSILFFRLRKFLQNSDVGYDYLKSLIIGKVFMSVTVLFTFMVAGLAYLDIYPFVFLFGVLFSMLTFSRYRRLDAMAIKELVFGDVEISVSHFFCGLVVNACSDENTPLFKQEDNESAFDHSRHHTIDPVYSSYYTINPASGLPMIGGIGGVDIAGNVYGANDNNR